MKKLFFICTLFFATLANATPIQRIVAFGDSLSDNGNLYEYMHHQLPSSPPYYQGRFSDGPVWIELLTEAYFPTQSKTRLLDYAFGGAGVSEDEDTGGLITVKKEIDSYLIAHHDKADPNSLYVVWIGANNYLAMPDNPEEVSDKVVLGIEHSLQELVDKGAQHIFVANLPDLGRTPLAKESEMQREMSLYSTLHNAKMAQVVTKMKAQYPHVQWIYFNVSEMLQELMDNPELFGLANIDETCYEAIATAPSAQRILRMVASVKASKPSTPCDGYLFFDPVHPTAIAHQIMAEKARQLLDDAKVEFESE